MKYQIKVNNLVPSHVKTHSFPVSTIELSLLSLSLSENYRSSTHIFQRKIYRERFYSTLTSHLVGPAHL